ncbi:aminotransferase class I/II-fold pyridoxal phosphate-dependent enzyme [Flavobacteriaceae bacterium TP-CH-4]|uniref:Aminotransferase class I/II-fold pyridoxal phosphate-dependent enzyme n=1 Tax=Pelagihabitans pacificus TaxID=2696054 RepID=A0A967AVT1_9FLAO|nr:methionine aminotransferase [Pelagihabitans pacificus]NHF60290.1 aminotransferase class I/II-fold pyridoxal phosphate-dependent enzyme [Pelagihabitans pacificus]
MLASKNTFRSKLPNVKTTIFTTVGNLARKHGALDLSQGFPNFDADPLLIELVAQAMKKGHNQYAPMQGYYGLREAITNKIQKLHQRMYDPENEITITVGATQAIFTAITAFVHPGDEVIVLKPAYDCYEPAIELSGGIPVLLQLNNKDFKVDWNAFRSIISPKTRMVIINTPHNPSGAIFSREDMLQLEEILRPTNIILVSDEVYEHIVFDGQEHESASRFDNLASRSFVCASFGKTFHVTGWKMGYCVAPAPLMKEFLKTHQFAVFSVDHPVQRALAEYLRNERNYLGLGGFYQQKRDFFLNRLSSSKFKFTPSHGTYFQLLDFSEVSSESDEALAERLIIDHKLACIPISSFNLDHQDHQLLRFCFAKTEETLESATNILNKL